MQNDPVPAGAQGQADSDSRPSQEITRLVVVGTILLALLAGLVALVIWLWRTISGSDSEVVAAVVAASATVLVSTAGIVLGRFNERKKEFEQRQQEKRIPVYEQFVDFWFRRVLYASKIGLKPLTEKDLNTFFAEFTRDLMVWGSDEVILQWVETRRKWATLGDRPHGKAAVAPMLDFERLLIAIRRDIGYPDTALPPGSLLGLFINDPEALGLNQTDD